METRAVRYRRSWRATTLISIPEYLADGIDWATGRPAGKYIMFWGAVYYVARNYYFARG